MTRPRYVACLGNSADAEAFGGTPFHLFEAGQQAGLFTAALDLRLAPPQLRGIAKGIRALGRFSRGLGVFGDQYSEDYIDSSWASFPEHDCSILNIFQLYPERIIDNVHIDKWFYIDQTLRQLFENYPNRRPSRRYLADIVRREQQQYQVASGIIATSEWARRSLVEEYAVNGSKVFVVARGANVYRAQASAAVRSTPKQRDPNAPLVLVFVGKEWKRKGLDRLIDGLLWARERGANIHLNVIGPRRAEITGVRRYVDGITWHGPINKAREFDRFWGILEGSHVGCLLSSAEAGGISLREFHLAGLPVIAPAVGGAPEFAIPEACNLVDPSASPAEIGLLIERLCRDQQLLLRQTNCAFQSRSRMTWDYAVREMQAIINGETHKRT